MLLQHFLRINFITERKINYSHYNRDTKRPLITAHISITTRLPHVGHDLNPSKTSHNGAPTLSQRTHRPTSHNTLPAPPLLPQQLLPLAERIHNRTAHAIPPAILAADLHLAQRDAVGNNLALHLRSTRPTAQPRRGHAHRLQVAVSRHALRDGPEWRRRARALAESRVGQRGGRRERDGRGRWRRWLVGTVGWGCGEDAGGGEVRYRGLYLGGGVSAAAGWGCRAVAGTAGGGQRW